MFNESQTDTNFILRCSNQRDNCDTQTSICISTVLFTITIQQFPINNLDKNDLNFCDETTLFY